MLLAVAGDLLRAEEQVHAAVQAQSSYDLPDGSGRIRLLRFGSRSIGAMVLCGPTEAVVADSVPTLVATHLVRIRSVRSEVRAKSQTFSESLRSAVMDGLAHAVKTPLTTIIAASSGLREIGQLTAVQDELTFTIESQAEHLAQVTDKLLRTVHLAGEDVLVRRAQTDVSAIYEQVKGEAHSGRDKTDCGLPACSLSPWSLIRICFACACSR